MFSNDIVGSDAFLEMPSTTQALYFHLGMRCDDDGFVNPNVTMRMTGANKNDLDVLITKKFLLPFKNGVVVIKHHRINNNWDARDSRRTLYTEELRTLFIKENRAYTFDENDGVPVMDLYPSAPLKKLPVGNPSVSPRQNRIEENRRKEVSIETSPSLKVEEIKIVPDDLVKANARKKEPGVLALRDKLYDMFEKEKDVRPTPHAGDYQMVKAAMNRLTQKQIIDLVEEKLEDGKVRTVREALSPRSVDIYLQDNV